MPNCHPFSKIPPPLHHFTTAKDTRDSPQLLISQALLLAEGVGDLLLRTPAMANGRNKTCAMVKKWDDFFSEKGLKRDALTNSSRFFHGNMMGIYWDVLGYRNQKCHELMG